MKRDKINVSKPSGLEKNRKIACYINKNKYTLTTIKNRQKEKSRSLCIKGSYTLNTSTETT